MPRGSHLLDFRRALPVLQLASVEVARLAVEPGLDVQPAEEDVAAGLHQALAGDDALAVVGELARCRGTPRAPTPRPPSSAGTAGRCRRGRAAARSRRACRRCRRRRPCARSRRARTARAAPAGRAGASRGRPPAARRAPRTARRVRCPRRGRRSARSAAGRRRSGPRRRPRRVSLENADMLSAVRALASVLLGPLDLPRLSAASRVPASALSTSRWAYQTLEVLHRREAAPSPRGIPRPCRARPDPAPWLEKPLSLRGDQHARREPLDVPLPRPRERLVEVVDVEHEPPLGRCRTRRSSTGARRRSTAPSAPSAASRPGRWP